MIHLEIIDGPDRNALNAFQFFQNAIYIGHSLGNLCIKDPLLKASHLMIEVVEKDLILHPQKNVESYLLDGKRASTVRKIKVGQIITIGSTQLKVIAYEETQFQTKKDILDQKLAQLIDRNANRLTVIEKLAQLMK